MQKNGDVAWAFMTSEVTFSKELKLTKFLLISASSHSMQMSV
jgi:hypothetical protein